MVAASRACEVHSPTPQMETPRHREVAIRPSSPGWNPGFPVPLPSLSLSLSLSLSWEPVSPLLGVAGAAESRGQTLLPPLGSSRWAGGRGCLSRGGLGQGVTPAGAGGVLLGKGGFAGRGVQATVAGGRAEPALGMPEPGPGPIEGPPSLWGAHRPQLHHWSPLPPAGAQNAGWGCSCMGHLAHPAGNGPREGFPGLNACVGGEALAAGPGAELGRRGGPTSPPCL